MTLNFHNALSGRLRNAGSESSCSPMSVGIRVPLFKRNFNVDTVPSKSLQKRMRREQIIKLIMSTAQAFLIKQSDNDKITIDNHNFCAKLRTCYFHIEINFNKLT